MSAGQIAAGVVAVVVVAAAVWRRRDLSGERKLIAAGIVLVCAVYASGVLSALPDPKKVIEDIAVGLGSWTYALVGVMAFLETGAFVGLIAPGETIVIAGGVIAGQGEIQLFPLIGLVWLCAILGDTTSFLLGRRLGREFLERHGPRVKITSERLNQVDGYFDRHGGKTILIGRFIGLVRAVAPFVAGSSGMPYGRFIPFSVVGTGLWSATFCVLGFVFWQSFDRVANIAGQAVLALGVLAAVIVGVVMVYRRRRAIWDWFLRHEDHQLLRPLFAAGRPVYQRVLRPGAQAVAPEARFVWNRLTPGGLGLELTTVLAVGGVGLYIFLLYATILAGDPGPTPFDRESLDLGDRLRVVAAVDVAKVVTELGSFYACAAVVLVTAVALAVRRRPGELLVLVAGLALVYVAVQATKAGLDRPRPGGPLSGNAGSAYPSGHSAYSIAWIAVALVVTRRLGVVGKAGLVTVAIVIAAVVGLTRIYLRVHWWSDVAGGWGLGAGIFSLLAAIVLIVDYMRHNETEREPRLEAPAVAHAER